MSTTLDNPYEQLRNAITFYDRHATIITVGETVTAQLSGEWDGERLFHFTDVANIPAASFTELAARGNLVNQTVLRAGRYGLVYKDYRKVDSSHVNKLHALTETIVADIAIHDVPALSGIAALPNGFIVATAINKTAAGGGFDRDLGIQYLSDDLTSKVDERLWQLEGYRVYRSVTTLDSFSKSLPDGDLAIRLLANGAAAVLPQNSKHVIISTVDAPVGMFPVDIPHMTVIDLASYYKITTVLNSYIERG